MFGIRATKAFLANKEKRKGAKRLLIGGAVLAPFTGGLSLLCVTPIITNAIAVTDPDKK